VSTRKAHCNPCGGSTNHTIRAVVEKSWEADVDDSYSIHGGDRFALLECLGCESVRMLHESWHSESTDADGAPAIDEVYYPPSKFRPEPEWISQLSEQKLSIARIFDEVYVAFLNNSTILAAMGVRAIIEAVMIDKVGDQGNFAANLVAFEKDGYISSRQLSVVKSALELGHATMHRGFCPSVTQLWAALDIIENLVHGIYVLPGKSQGVSASVPARKP
jgi:hypothetical protein